MRSVFFYRDFRRFTGGHLKVWDYFNHVLSSSDHRPYIRFSPETVWDRTNPWLAYRRSGMEGAPAQPDVRFLAGMDWTTLPPAERDAPPQPVINFIQHVRHATPGDKRHPFLRHPAIRVCVSEEVSEAVRAAGARGPVFTIRNGIDLSELRAPAAKSHDLFIGALKQRKLGGELLGRLKRSARRIDFLDRQVPRAEFLQRVARARVAVLLPDPEEGFYLPAIEAMAVGSTVVCPDCVGNREFCLPDVNCYRPEHEVGAIETAARAALALSPAEEARLRDAARGTAERYSLEEERRAFLELLGQVPTLWKECQ